MHTWVPTAEKLALKSLSKEGSEDSAQQPKGHSGTRSSTLELLFAQAQRPLLDVGLEKELVRGQHALVGSAAAAATLNDT